MQIKSTYGKIPTNMWAACVEMRKKGAIGKFYPHDLIVRAEPRDIQRFILDEVEALGNEPRAILWVGKIMHEGA